MALRRLGIPGCLANYRGTNSAVSLASSSRVMCRDAEGTSDQVGEHCRLEFNSCLFLILTFFLVGQISVLHPSPPSPILHKKGTDRGASSSPSPTSLAVPTSLSNRPFYFVMIFDPLPSQFRLKDLSAITGRVCELRVNAHQAEADRAARAWFNRYAFLVLLVGLRRSRRCTASSCTMTGNDPSL